MSQEIDERIEKLKENSGELVTLLKEAISNAQAFTEDIGRIRDAQRLTPFEFCIALIVSEGAAERAFPLEHKKAKQLMSEKIIEGKFEENENENENKT